MANEKHYINNADFLKALVDYKESCKIAIETNKPEPRIPNYIGECFLKIAEGLSHKPNFISYTYRDEMIADGIENCLMYFSNFDPAKSSNPFSYFTQIIYYAFLRRISKERKQMYVKYKSAEHFSIIDESGMFETEDGVIKQFEMYDNISEFIENFELSRDEKKLSKKKVKGIEKFLED